MLTLDKSNPVPFAQPFLCLAFKDENAGTRKEWYIDVAGKLRRYITRSHKPTKLLQRVLNELEENGYIVVYYGDYTGSAGPTHFLRHGAFFERMCVLEREQFQPSERQEDSAPESLPKTHQSLKAVYSAECW